MHVCLAEATDQGKGNKKAEKAADVTVYASNDRLFICRFTACLASISFPISIQTKASNAAAYSILVLRLLFLFSFVTGLDIAANITNRRCFLCLFFLNTKISLCFITQSFDVCSTNLLNIFVGPV